MLHALPRLDAQTIVSLFLVKSCLADKNVTGTNQAIWNKMRSRRSANFQLWSAQHVRILFVMYSGTKDVTNISMTIQHIYYYVEYQLYDHFTNFLPTVQSNVTYCPKHESRRWYEFWISFRYIFDRPPVILINKICHWDWVLYHFMCITYQSCVA